MASNYKNPPVFDEQKIAYETWKNELAIWRLVTDLPAKKQALAVSLCLTGKARDTAIEIKAEDLNKDNGMQVLLTKLDGVFLKDQKDCAYEAYRNFDGFRKSNQMSMIDYIIEFEQLYNRSTKYDMTLPDAVLAFKLLENSHLEVRDRQLAPTACTELSFVAMKSALKRIFGDKSPSDEPIQLNSDTVFMSQHNKYPPTARQLRGTNPLNRFGKRSKCAVCQSVFHWAKDCPDKASVNVTSPEHQNEMSGTETCNMTLFTDTKLSENQVLVVESLGSALIDTACTRTVCGRQWFEQYINLLGLRKGEVSVFPSHQAFRFGDGKVVYSYQRAVLPATIGSINCNIDTEVVNSDIPLLLSKSSLQKAGAILDLQYDRATLFNELIDLESTSSGHYCINLIAHSRDNISEPNCVLAVTDSSTSTEKQIRPHNVQFQTGDQVYYKRPDSMEWRGPGTVIGWDGHVVFVRHGGLCVRVHTCRLYKGHVTDGNEITNPTCNIHNTGENLDISHDENRNKELEHLDISDNESVGGHSAENDLVQQFETSQIKPGQTIKYKHVDNGDIWVDKVLSRSGKAKGPYLHWFNLKFSSPDYMHGEQASVNLSQVQDLETVTNNTELTDGSDEDENVLTLAKISVAEAKATELASWKSNDVYIEKPDIGQKSITTRWIWTLKDKSDKIVPKARLVARGFEELQNPSLSKDSPTCAIESLRVVLAVLALKQWEPHSMDIKTVFLQGTGISREVYVKPPIEANGVVWQLNKCVYGLANASLLWYRKVCEVMIDSGGSKLQVDPAVFFWYDSVSKCVCGILACHVDDFIWGGTEEFEQNTMGNIRSSFKVGREESKSFAYTGIELASSNNGIQLEQKEYLEGLQPIHIPKTRMLEPHSVLTKSEMEAYRSKIGQILWIARQTRPDAMFDASSLAASQKCAMVQNLANANKVIRKLQSEEVTLKFQCLHKQESPELIVSSDASLANLPEGGHLILLLVGIFLHFLGNPRRFAVLYIALWLEKLWLWLMELTMQCTWLHFMLSSMKADQKLVFCLLCVSLIITHCVMLFIPPSVWLINAFTLK